MDSDVFLSYQRTDEKLVDALVSSLESRGVSVWRDSRVEAGEDWRDSIVENRTNSLVLAIVFSEACNSSK